MENSKNKNKNKITIISSIVAVLVAMVVLIVFLIPKNPYYENYANFESLKTQSNITKDITTFKTDINYFVQTDKGIHRLYKEKGKNIIVSVDDNVKEDCYFAFEKCINFLNEAFETINNKYVWEIHRASDLAGKKANITIQTSYLSEGKAMNCTITENSNGLNIGSIIKVDHENFDNLTLSSVNVSCLREMLSSLGLKYLDDQNFYGKSIMYTNNIYTYRISLLPYDIRNLICAYSDIETEERLETLKKITINTKYVSNTHNYQDLDMDYGNSLDW